jgi:hypothetical protein
LRVSALFHVNITISFKFILFFCLLYLGSTSINLILEFLILTANKVICLLLLFIKLVHPTVSTSSFFIMALLKDRWNAMGRVAIAPDTVYSTENLIFIDA